MDSNQIENVNYLKNNTFCERVTVLAVTECLVSSTDDLIESVDDSLVVVNMKVVVCCKTLKE
jgi:hypothetical protein